MVVRIKGEPTPYTLLTIVPETYTPPTNKGLFTTPVSEIKAFAWVYDKSGTLKKFLADDIERIEK